MKFLHDVRTWYRTVVKKEFVRLRTLKDSDDDAYTYIMTEDLIPRAELPPDAKHCRGEGNVYCLNLIDVDSKEIPVDIDGYTAHDGWRFAHSDVYDDLLSALWKEGDHVPLVKILTIIGIVVAVVIGLWIFGGSA